MSAKLPAVLNWPTLLSVTCKENDFLVKLLMIQMHDQFYLLYLCGLKSCFVQEQLLSPLGIVYGNFDAHFKILLQAIIIIHSFFKIHVGGKKIALSIGKRIDTILLQTQLKNVTN